VWPVCSAQFPRFLMQAGLCSLATAGCKAQEARKACIACRVLYVGRLRMWCTLRAPDTNLDRGTSICSFGESDSRKLEVPDPSGWVPHEWAVTQNFWRIWLISLIPPFPGLRNPDQGAPRATQPLPSRAIRPPPRVLPLGWPVSTALLTTPPFPPFFPPDPCPPSPDPSFLSAMAALAASAAVLCPAAALAPRATALAGRSLRTSSLPQGTPSPSPAPRPLFHCTLPSPDSLPLSALPARRGDKAPPG